MLSYQTICISVWVDILEGKTLEAEKPRGGLGDRRSGRSPPGLVGIDTPHSIPGKTCRGSCCLCNPVLVEALSQEPFQDHPTAPLYMEASSSPLISSSQASFLPSLRAPRAAGSCGGVSWRFERWTQSCLWGSRRRVRVPLQNLSSPCWTLRKVLECHDIFCSTSFCKCNVVVLSLLCRSRIVNALSKSWYFFFIYFCFAGKEMGSQLLSWEIVAIDNNLCNW